MFIHEDILYFNIQLDFVEGRLNQIDHNRILDHFNEYNTGPIIKKAFYKFKKNNDYLKLTYKKTV